MVALIGGLARTLIGMLVGIGFCFIVVSVADTPIKGEDWIRVFITIMWAILAAPFSLVALHYGARIPSPAFLFWLSVFIGASIYPTLLGLADSRLTSMWLETFGAAHSLAAGVVACAIPIGMAVLLSFAAERAMRRFAKPVPSTLLRL